MVLEDAVSKLESFDWIWKHVYNFCILAGSGIIYPYRYDNKKFPFVILLMVIHINHLLSFDALFLFSFPLAESPPRDLQISAYK